MTFNIIKDLTRRIESEFAGRKNACANYATEAAAEKATANAAMNVAKQFHNINSMHDAMSAYYVVFYIESLGRWFGAINMGEVLARRDATGGYLGVEPRFFKF